MRNPGYSPSRTNSIDSSMGDMGSPLDGDAEDDMTYEKLEAEAREVTDISIIYSLFSIFIQRANMSDQNCLFGSENSRTYSWEID
jgi:hypothetical protein